MSGNKAQELEHAAFVEERQFFRSQGYNDRWIAQRLGIEWDSYRARFRRHPELGPIADPDEYEREHAVGWKTILRGSRGRKSA